MTMDEGAWPNEAGFDTTYEEHEPVELIVKGTIPYYAAGVLCEPRHSTISN
jgi:torulene dioxygenase